MRVSRLVASAVAAVGALALLGAAGTPGVRDSGDSGAAVLARVGSDVAAIRRARDTHCDCVNCTSGQHQNTSRQNGGNKGELHSCAFSLNDCADHGCMQTSAGEILDLENTIPKLDGAAIHTLSQTVSGSCSIANEERFR